MSAMFRMLLGLLVVATAWSAQAEPRDRAHDDGHRHGHLLRYRVVDLGAGVAWGLNDLGQATGVSGDVNGAFLWSPGGGMKDLGGFVGTGAVGRGVNRHGAVAGFNDSAFVYGGASGPTYTAIGGALAQAMAINDGDTATGYFEPGSVDSNGVPNQHAFAFKDGHLQDLGTPPNADSSFGRAINRRGDVVGTWRDDTTVRAFFKPVGKPMIDLGPDTLEGFAINAHREVVGQGFLRDGKARAFYWTPRTGVVDIAPRGTDVSEAVSINDAGAIVIHGYTGSGDAPYLLLPHRHAVPLRRLLVPQDRRQWDYLFATAINNRGQIVGSATRRDGVGGFRAVLFDPVREDGRDGEDHDERDD